MGNSPGGELFAADTVEILEKLSGPTPISIDDKFWLEFVKIRLPDEFFYEKYYEGASILDGMVKKYFLRLMATNETSGNFSTFLRFWTRLLNAYRTSPRDTLPCSVDAILSLATLCRVLLKQFCESFAAPELIYHFEMSSSRGEQDRAAVDGDSFVVIYRGQAHSIPVANVREVTENFIHQHIQTWVDKSFPEESVAFKSGNFVLRPTDGEGVLNLSEVGPILAAAEGEDKSKPMEFNIVSLSLPPSSTVASMLVEMCEFCIFTGEGCLPPSDSDDADLELTAQRSGSVDEERLQVQSTLIEVLILLCAVIRPPRGGSSEQPRPSASLDSDDGNLLSLAPYYYTFSAPTGGAPQVLVFLEVLLECFKQSPADPLRGSICMNFVTFLTNSIGIQMGATRGIPSGSGARLAYRALTLLMSGLYYRPADGGENLFQESIAKVVDPALQGDGSPKQGKPQCEVRLMPISFEHLLQAILKHLSEHMFVFLFYVLIYKNPSFRLFCLARTDLEEIFEPMFILLYRVPTICDNLKVETIPPPATVLCICLLILSKDRSIIASTSRISLRDVPWFEARHLTDISLSSVWILVLLRLLQWNFKNYKDDFFVSILAGIFSNMATNGIEDLHWYTAQRLVDVTNMLAKTTIQICQEETPEMSPRALPYRLLLANLLQFQWSMLDNCNSASRNPTLVFTLMRAIPKHVAALPEHLPAKSLPARCVVALKDVMEWFHQVIQEVLEEDEDAGHDVQLEALKKAAGRMPEFDHLKDRQPRPFCYDETVQSIMFFMPVVWRSVYSVMPSQVCWRKREAVAVPN